MEEDEKKKQSQESQTPTDGEPANGQNGEGNSPGQPNAIEQANKAVADLKVENDRRESLQKREEELIAEKKIMGGVNYGGKPEPKVLTDEEYSEKFEKGEVDLFEKGR